MRIHFFTSKFPYDKSEAFIENELPVLSTFAEVINIYPYIDQNYEHIRNVPSNVRLINHSKLPNKYLGFFDYILLSRIILVEFLLSKKKLFYLKKIRTWVVLIKNAIQTANSLDISKHQKNDCYYSYWMNEWATVLLVLKMKKRINKFVFRCGGYDIWDERREGNYMPFRGIIYKYATGVYPNSKKAEIYLKGKKFNPDIIKHMYWGTNDLGESRLEENEKFTIVSCSNIIPLKRVELIVEIIKNLEFSVRWVHFGSGELFEKIESQSRDLTEKHEIIFKGNVSNAEVLQYYKSNSVNLFLTTSSTEGLPVSVQEAISFGIPVLATDVGGMSEVVTQESGILIPANFNVRDVTKIIEDFRISEKNSVLYRKGVKNYWKSKFEAKQVYLEFYKELHQRFQN